MFNFSVNSCYNRLIFSISITPCTAKLTLNYATVVPFGNLQNNTHGRARTAMSVLFAGSLVLYYSVLVDAVHSPFPIAEKYVARPSHATNPTGRRV